MLTKITSLSVATPLLFFFLPIYLIKITIAPGISINLLELLLFFAIIANYSTTFYFLEISTILSDFKSNKKILLPVAIILTSFAISTILNTNYSKNNWSDSLGKYIDLLLLPILFAYSLHLLNPAIQLQITTKFKKAFLKLLGFFPPGMTATVAYYFSASLVSFWGIIYLLTGNLTFDNRLNIFFQSPNELAIFLSPAMIIGLSFLFGQFQQNFFSSFFKNWLLYLSLFAIALNIIFTKSLGALIAISIVAILMMTQFPIVETPFLRKILTFFNKNFKKIFLSILVLSLLAFFNLSPLLQQLNYQPTVPASSFDSRLTIYQVSLAILKQHPFIGIGINHFQDYYLLQQANFSPFPQWAVPHSHNNLIHFWLEGGLMAFLSLFWLYYIILTPNLIHKINKPLRGSIQDLKPTSKIPQYSLAQLTLIYFIIHGLIDTSIWTPASATFFWFTTIYYLTKPAN